MYITVENFINFMKDKKFNVPQKSLLLTCLYVYFTYKGSLNFEHIYGGALSPKFYNALTEALNILGSDTAQQYKAFQQYRLYIEDLIINEK